MTALDKYERLEAIGLWKESEMAQRREVIVSFGSASLVLSDVNGKPLTHWSFAAVSTLNGETSPVIYGLDQSVTETLEIYDPEMIGAITEVLRYIRRASPRPGRLRWMVSGVVLMLLLLIGLFWLPSISADYATKITPQAKAAQIGQTLLRQTVPLTGSPCDNILGRNSLRKLESWLLPEGGHIHVVDMGARFSTHLPDGNILLNRYLIEEETGPEVAAGFVLMEKTLMAENPPLTDMFRSFGTRKTLTFIANGHLRDEDLAEYARTRLTETMTRPDDALLLQSFEKAKLTSAPLAFALDASGKSTETLIDQDPIKGNYQPQITDQDWIALQSICGDG